MKRRGPMFCSERRISVIWTRSLIFNSGGPCSFHCKNPYTARRITRIVSLVCLMTGKSVGGKKLNGNKKDYVPTTSFLSQLHFEGASFRWSFFCVYPNRSGLDARISVFRIEKRNCWNGAFDKYDVNFVKYPRFFTRLLHLIPPRTILRARWQHFKKKYLV